MTVPASLGERLPHWPVAGFSAAQVRAYGEASNDDNPIHLDPGAAAAAGLPACPVQGMLIAAQFETAIRRWRANARIVRLSVRFVRPLFTGTPVDIGGRVAATDGDGLVVRLIVTGADGRTVCVGAATVHL